MDQGSSGRKKSGYANRKIQKKRRAEDEIQAGAMAKFLKLGNPVCDRPVDEEGSVLNVGDVRSGEGDRPVDNEGSVLNVGDVRSGEGDRPVDEEGSVLNVGDVRSGEGDRPVDEEGSVLNVGDVRSAEEDRSVDEEGSVLNVGDVRSGEGDRPVDEEGSVLNVDDVRSAEEDRSVDEEGSVLNVGDVRSGEGDRPVDEEGSVLNVGDVRSAEEDRSVDEEISVLNVGDVRSSEGDRPVDEEGSVLNVGDVRSGEGDRPVDEEGSVLNVGDVRSAEEDRSVDEEISVLNVGDVRSGEGDRPVDEEGSVLNVGDVRSAEEDRSVDEEISVLNDIAAWPVPLTKQIRVEIVKKGHVHYQNKDGPFTPTQRLGSVINAKGSTRSLNTKWFYKVLPSGEEVLRTWMCYSVSTNKIYCFCCRLFAANHQEVQKFVSGFNDFWKLNPKIKNHEESDWHQTNFKKWKTLQIALKRSCAIDNKMQEQWNANKSYWRNLLHRLLHVTLFLAKQNLAFRGHDESASSTNRGNFLELVDLLSFYDPLLKEHMLKVQEAAKNPGQRIHTYLSPGIQNEFINMLGREVRKSIIKEIKDARIYGIMFDSTPDVSHMDQFSEVIRYVHINNGNVEVKEAFLRFIVTAGKTAQDLSNEILANLQEDGLDIMDCRAQGYDNAATMAGIHGGVQAKIKEINPKAIFVACANHSLNLCGVRSFEANVQGVTFFGTLEKVFAFFSVSTHRWDVMKTKMEGSSLKRLSNTRWSAHHDSVKVAKEHFAGLVEALECLMDSSESMETRSNAESLSNAICTFSFVCHLSMWYDLLKEVNNVQLYLQRKGLNLDEALIRLNALSLFLESRNSIIDHAIAYGEEKCHEYDITMEQRQRRRRRMPGELARDAGLSLSEEIRRSLAECFDRFVSELNTRKQAISRVADIFSLVCHDVLMHGTDEVVLQKGAKMADTFDEFQTDTLLSEIKRLRQFVQAAEIPSEEINNWTAIQFLTFIVQYDFQESTPYITLALKLYLTTCVSVASCERSFSKLKLIKNYLRSTMGQDRLCNLAILSIENERTSTIDFEKAIDDFAAIKTRKERF